MSDRAVLSAEYVNIKTVVSRKSVQLVFEVPIEQMADAVQILGSPVDQTRVAIAVLKTDSSKVNDEPKAAKDKRAWHDLTFAEQAGIACNDPKFMRFMKVKEPSYAVLAVRKHCGVDSRAKLDTDARAGRVWVGLYREFREWLRTQEKAS